MNSYALEHHLQEIADATPTVASSFENDPDAFVIQLPHHATLDGRLEHGENVSIATLEDVHVPSILTNHGIGSRLIQSFFRYCDENLAEQVVQTVISPHVLHIEKRLLGEHAIHFVETVEGETVELPITVDQACMSIARAEEHYAELERQGHEPDEIGSGFTVRINIDDVDTTAWELPEEGELDTHTDEHPPYSV